MATTTTPSTPTPPTSTPRRVDLRNPTPLSATQEGEVSLIIQFSAKSRGRRTTDDELQPYEIGSSQLTLSLILSKEFAACAVNRTVTATWVCRKQRLAMNACMVLHAKPEVEDQAREEWFAGREARIKAREKEARETEERRQEVLAMMKWDDERRAAAAAAKAKSS
ncbi:uncharacterized protein GIQ15_00781 [Arthroderma uncinatum]|uniref:uncharacterized protein n=1 Tax=Arthroderma uncinatum TaxID=74035 RepID=UPI00144A5B26|nr:uncharacterized protein GIQ15_00781 [Arthroderma uncinatum]KAF3491264.1 hypothetical protein GIQ15_00781 [Arthroderma uncinatum]